MSTPKQEEAFKKMVGEELPKKLLGSAIDWIRDNMNPDQVFNSGQLKAFVGDTCMPEEVFSQDELHKWARENGYMKERKDPILSPAYDNGI